MAEKTVISANDVVQWEGSISTEELTSLIRTARHGPWPPLAADGVLIEDDRILLIRRGGPPYSGMHALPGGFVELGEMVEDAVVREVYEETGIISEIIALIGIYSAPDRDPRGHTISAAYLLRYLDGSPKGGDDARSADWHPLNDIPSLAFDHMDIVKEGVSRYEQHSGR